MNPYIFDSRNTGEIYRNDLSSLTGLTVSETNGTITIDSPYGSPNLGHDVLTIEWTSSGGATYAGIDLGQTYDELYIQCYVTVINGGGQSGYKDFLQVGSNINGNSEVCQIQVNHSATDYRYFGVPGYQNHIKRFTYGEIARLGIHINKNTSTVDYYYNGVLAGQKSINNQDLQYITFGGNNASGTILQFSDITVNEQQFSIPTQNDYMVGIENNIYVDYSMDDSIDASSFTGMLNEPMSLDGGSTYVDGPLRYFSDTGTNYVDKRTLRKILFKKGIKHKIKDLTDSHKTVVLGASFTDSDNYYTVTGYGSGSDYPMLDTSIVVNSGSWGVYDDSNNIYSSSISNGGNLVGVWVDETLGYSLANSLTDLETKSGLYFVNSGILYIRLYDDSDPSTHIVDLIGNQGFSINDYCKMIYIEKRLGGMVVGTYNDTRYCEFNTNAGASVSDYGVLRNCNFRNNWASKDYNDVTFSTPDGNSISVGDNGIVYYNTVEESYIGIQSNFNNENVLIAFNTVKNIIVNHIQISGGDGDHGGDTSKAIRVINNTVFSSPRHKQNDPYFITDSQPGHAIVLQSGLGSGSSAYVDVINNLMMVHYNYTNTMPTASKTANCLHNGNLYDIGICDYNRVYKGPNTDLTKTGYFTDGNWTTYQEFADVIEAKGFTGVDRVSSPCENSLILTGSIPVTQADTTTDSGKWLTTNPIPVSEDVIGQGYEFDFSQWGITRDANGNLLTNNRNIGSF